MKLLVTGGAGFIGSAFIRHAMALGHDVINIDCLTYAANLDNLAGISSSPRYLFSKTDICDGASIAHLLSQHRPAAIIHFAAETHVDRSIDGPSAFIRTNIEGTYTLLNESFQYWKRLDDEDKRNFRFLHISTDEVYGDLNLQDPAFTETTPYNPSSPYSASKAGSDHLVRAWHRTYDFPTMITNCSNNYGPYQFPEKLIPVVTLKALRGLTIPVYGTGENIRDWLHVDDHARALVMVLDRGRIGETYNIGGNAEMSNLHLVNQICEIMDTRRERKTPHSSLIEFVEDRPGHDKRYAIDTSKIEKELGWRPKYTLSEGLKQTVDWYLENGNWWLPLLSKSDADMRLGLAK